MQIQNKKEIKLSIEDLTKIVSDYLSKEHQIYGTIRCDWMVKNKPIATSWRDSMDNYVFDGVDITVTT